MTSGRAMRFPARMRSTALRSWAVLLPVAGMFGIAAARQPTVTEMLLTSGFGAVCVLLARRDLEDYVVPNRIVYAAVLVVLAASPLRPGGTLGSVEGALAGGVPLAVVCLLTSGGIGAGDAKMAALVGAFVGFPAILNALVVAVIGGGLVAALLIVLRVPPDGGFAYAPLLALGGAVMLLW